jgi:hypothetical protein
VFCEPVGIGYYDPAVKENWVYEDYEHSQNKWQGGKEPGYEYPIVEKNPEFRQAVRHIFEGINESQRAQSLSFYKPAAKDIAVLQKVTGADTIILERVHGQQFTAERHLGALAQDVGLGIAGVAVGRYYVGNSQPQETLESFLVCVEASTGGVLWQHGLFGLQQPSKPAPSFMKQVLESFPNVGEPMNPKYATATPPGAGASPKQETTAGSSTGQSLPTGSLYGRFNLHYHALEQFMGGPYGSAAWGRPQSSSSFLNSYRDKSVKVAGCVSLLDCPRHAVLPYNTEFRVTGLWRGGFMLQAVDSGVEIRFEYRSAYMRGMSIPDYLNLIMSPTAVSYEDLSEVDRQGIEAGEARVGMSKLGVEIALGHPPMHRTPSLEDNRWTYWKDRRRLCVVEFDDSGKVARITG